MGTPVVWIFVLLVGFLAVRFVMEQSGAKMPSGTFAEIKVSLWNTIAIAILAIPGIVIIKALSNKFLAANNPLLAIINTA